MHPAVAFGAVLAGVAVLGAPGALLALPMGASLQAFLSTYIRRYEVAAHPLLSAAEEKREDPGAATGPPPGEQDEAEAAPATQEGEDPRGQGGS